MITVSQSDLVRAASTAAAAVAQKSATPLIGGMRIEARDGVLSIVGTDLATIVRARCAASGSLRPVVVSTALVDRAKLMPAGPVSIALDGSALIISSGKRKFRLDTLDAADFPRVEIAEPTAEPTDAASLAVAIGRGTASMGEDMSRAHLYGALFRGGHVRSTDGNSLSSVPFDAAIDAFLPRGAVESIARFIDRCETVRVGTDEGRVVVARNDAVLSCATGDASAFPPVEQMLGMIRSGASMTVRRATILDVVRAVSAASADKDFRSVTIEAGRGAATVTAGDHGEDSFDCETSDLMWFTANGRYLIAAINASDGEEIAIESAGEEDPIVIRGTTTLHVVMPIRADASAKRRAA